jgi:hypothetical protein
MSYRDINQSSLLLGDKKGYVEDYTLLSLYMSSLKEVTYTLALNSSLYETDNQCSEVMW